MFTLFNPPRRGKKTRLRRRKAKKFSFFTPGGGHIFARNKGKKKLFQSFFNRRHRAAHLGGTPMARRRGRRGRHVRFNAGSLMAAPRQSGGRWGLGSLKPGALMRNMTGAIPILAGVVADGMFTKSLGSKIPYTGRGIGQIALGLAGAGLLRMVGNYANRQLGEGLFVGGVVGTLGCAFQNFMRDGLRSLSLSDDLDGFGYNDTINSNPYTNNSFMGMGQFVSPGQIASAFPSESTGAQYSLPNANAQMQPAHTPAQAASARRMSDYEGAAIGAMLGDSGDGMSGIL